jgi:hypothetical protein
VDFHKIKLCIIFYVFHLSGLFVVLDSVWVIIQKSSWVRSNDQSTISCKVNRSYISKTQSEEYCLLVCDAMQIVRSLPMFWRNILASSSGSKSKIKQVFLQNIRNLYQSTCYIQEDSTLHSCHHENIKCHQRKIININMYMSLVINTGYTCERLCFWGQTFWKQAMFSFCVCIL